MIINQSYVLQTFSIIIKRVVWLEMLINILINKIK